MWCKDSTSYFHHIWNWHSLIFWYNTNRCATSVLVNVHVEASNLYSGSHFVKRILKKPPLPCSILSQHCVSYIISTSTFTLTLVKVGWIVLNEQRVFFEIQNGDSGRLEWYFIWLHRRILIRSRIMSTKIGDDWSNSGEHSYLKTLRHGLYMPCGTAIACDVTVIFEQ